MSTSPAWLKSLEDGARAASKESWYFERQSWDDGSFSYERNTEHFFISIRENEYDSPMKGFAKKDATHIANCSPDRILALTELLRGLVESVQTLECECGPDGHYVCGRCGVISKFQAGPKGGAG